MLAFYGVNLPYHPGKWRVVDAVYRSLRLAPADPSLNTPVVRRGLQWELREDCTIQRSLRFLGVYEREETSFLDRWWKPGITVLDIGSNFGYYGLLAAEKAGSSGRVIAFEPYPPNRVQLQRNLELNQMDWVEVEDRALSDATGTVSFIIPPDSCLGVGRIAANDGIRGQRVEVETLPLDAFATAANLEALDFVKLDVEGAEARVVRGGWETLKRFQPAMLVEINPEGLKEFGSTPEELVGMLQELGYGLFRVKGGRLQRLPVGEGVDYEAMFGDHGNTIAVPENEV